MALEEPRHEVVSTFDDFEVRRYAPYVIAEIAIDGTFEDAGSEAFRTLVAYIGGANRGATEMPMTAPVLQAPGKGETIEMTAPVLQRSGTEAETFRVAFVLPQRYDLAGAPPPTDPRVHLREVPARLVAAHRYTGFWSEARYRDHEAILLTALEAAGYEAVGAPEWARYNPPFMPWFLRRNEIMVEVRQTDRTRR